MHTGQTAAPAIWSTALQVHSYDVDVTRCATVPSLCRNFLEAAWNHAESLGVGFNHLAQQDRVWVLSRLLVEIKRRPRWGETIKLSTWPRGINSLFAMREFNYLDSTDNLLCAGTSGWLVLNRTNRRPQRIQALLENLPATNRRAAARDPEKLSARACAGVSIASTARPSDIDVNGHVNSARYIEWVLDTYSLQFHKTHELGQLEVNYLGETLSGDSLTTWSEETAPSRWHHSIMRGPGTEVCRAQLSWQPAAPGERR